MSDSRGRSPWTLALLVLLVVATAVTIGLAFARQSTQPAVAAGHSSLPTASPSKTAAPATVRPIGKGSRVVIFGDSWVYGQAANPPTKGFAYLVAADEGWKATINGVPETGFNNAGRTKQGTYLQRISKLSKDPSVQAVIVEGGINDAFTNHSTYAATVTTALKAIEGKYPKAQLIVLGPAAFRIPVPPELVEVDSILTSVAAELRAPYISPLQQQWITGKNFPLLMAGEHPSTAGHAYIAGRLEKALDAG